jgi:TadE-like protein
MRKSAAVQTRRGAALVELAICLPIVVFILFAGMDVTTLLRMNQAIVETTHETARILATNEVNEAQCRQFATDLLTGKNLSNATVQFDPVPTPDMPRGTPISISITVPVTGNCTLISQLYSSLTLRSQSTVTREIGDFN